VLKKIRRGWTVILRLSLHNMDNEDKTNDNNNKNKTRTATAM
jgi:hypothetical protein